MGQAFDETFNDAFETAFGPGLGQDDIRRLRPTDLPAFRAHMLRLDGATRTSRFAMSVSDAFLLRYCEQCFSSTAQADGVLLLGHFRAGEIRGAAELRPVARREAEAAFSVEPLCRGRGLGTALFTRLLAAARERRLKRLYMSCLARNRAMQALARKFEAEVVFEDVDLLGLAGADARPLGPDRRDGVGAGYATAILDLHPGWFRLPKRRDGRAV